MHWGIHCQDNPSGIGLIRLCLIGGMNTHDDLPRINISWREGRISLDVSFEFGDSESPTPMYDLDNIDTGMNSVLRVEGFLLRNVTIIYSSWKTTQIVYYRSNDDFLISCSQVGWEDRTADSNGIIFIVIGVSGQWTPVWWRRFVVFLVQQAWPPLTWW